MVGWWLGVFCLSEELLQFFFGVDELHELCARLFVLLRRHGMLALVTLPTKGGVRSSRWSRVKLASIWP